jgi:hypothetical protein
MDKELGLLTSIWKCKIEWEENYMNERTVQFLNINVEGLHSLCKSYEQRLNDLKPSIGHWDIWK